jgi:hypothetical protein
VHAMRQVIGGSNVTRHHDVGVAPQGIQLRQQRIDDAHRVCWLGAGA